MCFVGEKIVSNLARVVVVVWIFVVLVLTLTYTASLSARLTIFKLQHGDTDVNTLIRNGDYVGCREGTFLAGFLKSVGFDESKIRIYKGAKELEVALSKGSEKGGITAMFSGSPYADVFLSKYCNKYMKVGSPYLTEGIAFGFRKGSPLVGDVSSAITILTDNHKIAEIRAHWIRSGCNEDDPSKVGSNTNIGLRSFNILFAVTGLVTWTCVVLFLVSFFYNNWVQVKLIYNEPGTIWSKFKNVCKLFDTEDTTYIRPDAVDED